MTSTTALIDPRILIKSIKEGMDAADIATKAVYQVLWANLIDYLSKNWIIIVSFLTIFLFIAIIKAILGRWRMLGSILYHYIYFGILFTIGLIFGSDIFVNNIFSVACTVILYPVCYKVVGIILVQTGLKR
jgi:hypothetical protein